MLVVTQKINGIHFDQNQQNTFDYLSLKGSFAKNGYGLTDQGYIPEMCCKTYSRPPLHALWKKRNLKTCNLDEYVIYLKQSG